MIEIEKTYGGKQLRIFVEDGEVLLSVRDLCWLLGDRNSNRKLTKAGIDNARYRSLDTNGGVQRMRLVSPRECETLLGSLRATFLSVDEEAGRLALAASRDVLEH